ncbi:MAG TPA: hypothetical protein VLE54_04025, partial [Thermoanaerobaculia bacterium]|nr:hypothetical protein [Thermoanaerobaculia bacterium]
MFSRNRVVVLTLVSIAIGSGLIAQSMEIPVANWTVPPYRGMSSSGGLSTMTDVSPGIAFVAMSPCRVVDTRNAAGPYGGPALASNVARTFDIDNGPCTGIPAGVDAYSLSFGAIVPPADGFLTAWPTGISQPTISQLNYLGGEVIANAAIVPAGTGGSINVIVNVGPTNVYIDINGYFTDSYNAGVQLVASGSVSGSGMILGTNAELVANGTAGVKGVQGTAVASAPNQNPAGVVGTSSNSNGVLGITALGSAGAGVLGIRTSGTSSVLSSGELGVSNLGGRFFNDVEINGDITVGTADTTFGPGNADFGGSVTVDGNLNVLGGTKNFVEPHATDASKVIRYVSLEGPESGTYFRGRGRFQNGIARIAVPEDFR